MKTATVSGHRCQVIREERGLTQHELARRIGAIYPRGVSNTTIAHIESGRRQPSAGLFVALCTVLDVPRDALIAEKCEAA